MRVNSTTVLRGRRVWLVPYRPQHVPIYHAWMQRPELLEQTCSDRLTLEEEMANQQSWHEDERKVTFIICARGGDGSPEAGATCDAGTTTTPQDAPTPPDTPPFDLTLNMVGDVNAFLSEIISDPQGDEDEGEPTGRLSAEMEVMIADASQRRRGMAEEALLLLIHFLLDRVPAVRELVAKVSDGNEASLRLFTHRLGFHTRRRLDVFSQTELAMDAADARRRAEDAWRESGAREMEAPV